MSEPGKDAILRSCLKLAVGGVVAWWLQMPGLAAQAGVEAAAGSQPNIVFILADDLGWADVGFHGTEIKTPNIDKLAAEGVRLESFYTLPVCTPARACLMTGRHPIRYGLQFNVIRPGAQHGLAVGERTLPQALREAGYQTAICGKWHLGEAKKEFLPMQRGFDHQYGMLFGHLDYFTHMEAGALDWHRDEKALREEGYSTHLIAQEAIRLIKQRDVDRPMFLYIAFNAPHTPLQCPPEYVEPYRHLSETRRIYAGMVAAMDEDIGKIVAAIEQQGLRKNTLFVFSSDNGGLVTKGDIASNSPLRGGKGSLYEGGIRVPTFATWDGHAPAGQTVEEPLHMVDWYPTLLRLAGAPLEQPQPLDGLDIWPVITQGKPSPHDAILFNTVGREGAIRTGDWKLIRDGQSGEDENGDMTREARLKKKQELRTAPAVYELFNIAQDPFEKTNLAGQYPEKVQELAKQLDMFSKEAVPPLLNRKPKGFKTPDVWGNHE